MAAPVTHDVVLGHPALAAGGVVVAAVGARELSGGGRDLCRRIGGELARAGHVVRTGGAPGADLAYARGAADAGGTVELVLPWAGFTPGAPAGASAVVADPVRHPSWFALAEAQDGPRHYDDRPGREARLLAARNAGIVVGGDGLGPPAALCVAVHPGAAPAGGTAHALACARACGVPVLVLRPPAGPQGGRARP